ncbi:unnamed protein product, partial [Closterium sp. NIES-53]
MAPPRSHTLPCHTHLPAPVFPLSPHPHPTHLFSSPPYEQQPPHHPTPPLFPPPSSSSPRSPPSARWWGGGLRERAIAGRGGRCMDPKQGSSHSGERKNLKRKLADSACPSGSDDSGALATAEVQAHIAVLKGSLTWREADRVAARKAAHAIAELAKHEEHVDAIVEEGAIHALVPHLSAPAVEEGDGPIACEHEVEKDAAFALGLLAIK